MINLIFIIIILLIEFSNCVGKPKLQELSVPKQIQEGESVKLHCDLKKGKQPIQFFWKLNDEPLKNDENFLIIKREEDTTLKIKNLSFNHLVKLLFYLLLLFF